MKLLIVLCASWWTFFAILIGLTARAVVNSYRRCKLRGAALYYGPPGGDDDR